MSETLRYSAKEKGEVPTFQIELPASEIKDEQYDHNCMQASVQMILKEWEPDKTFTLDELNKISQKREGMGTWPGAIASWLADRGYFSFTPISILSV